jgi:hypothetical protein
VNAISFDVAEPAAFSATTRTNSGTPTGAAADTLIESPALADAKSAAPLRIADGLRFGGQRRQAEVSRSETPAAVVHATGGASVSLRP